MVERMLNIYIESVVVHDNNCNINDKSLPQYDAFVKFIDHQIQKRFNESMAPSYLS